jgi:hypothetical protein
MPLSLHNDAYKRRSTWGRIKDYPFIHALSAALIFSALSLLAQLGPSPLGDWLVGTMSVIAVLGGLSMIAGLQWRGQRFNAFAIERAGHLLAMLAWFINLYFVIMAGAGPTQVASLLAFVVAHFIRFRTLAKAQRNINDTMSAVREEYLRTEHPSEPGKGGDD